MTATFRTMLNKYQADLRSVRTRGIPFSLKPENYYVSYYPGVTGKQGWERVLCPFHDDHNPSMSVNLDHGGYCCFACGASGDLIAFHMAMHGYSFREAVRDLETRYGL